MDKCIHELFEERVHKAPETVALVFENQQLTYGELNKKANQLAHHLKKLGVGPDVLVAICVERSLEMIVGIMGILKAGGAYVPLDPEYPAERLAFMLQDARVALVLTQHRLIEQLPDHSPQLICLDTDWENIAREPQENPRSAATGANLAYVIYTSGTTGTPKGVEITHYNIRRLFQATDLWFHFTAADVWTMFHSYAFDFSVWEIWGALLYGGRLVVVPYWISRSPDEFRELLCRERITVLNQTPSAFWQLMDAERATGGRNRLEALRYLIFGGEALDFMRLRPWFDRYGDQTPQVINMYGITETTVHVTYRRVKETEWGSRIGVPIPDLQLFVLDEHKAPVPVGVPGELYVGGAGLARGYLNRPELTAERFVPCPSEGGRTQKMYKSGDLVRRLSDGDLEYLGRVDSQVKIRGFRIELAEIESVLNELSAVRHSAVVVREDESGDNQLVAYVVLREPSLKGFIDWRRFLKRKLPDHMVPSAFVILDHLTLTINGKVDRQALPPPTSKRAELPKSHVSPRTSTEKILARIWAEVLKVEPIGIHDNFFDLGGHSLSAVQVMSRIRDALHVVLSLRAIFEAPTIAGLAECVQNAHRRGGQAGEHNATSLAPPVTRPLSFAQQRLWFLDQLDPGTPLYNIAEAFRLSGPLDAPALERSISEIIRRHEALRTTFLTVDGTAVQLVFPNLPFTLTTSDISNRPDAEAEAKRLARKEAERPFDLAHGPLLRTRLLRLRHQDHILLLTMHHIISDGWSLAIFLRELTALYNAFAEGQANPLSELSVQYSDYSQWQHRLLSGEALERQVDYWKTNLYRVATLQLPTDRPRPAAQRYHGEQQTFVLPSGLTKALKALSRQQHATLFMTLLAAFKALLHRYSGQRDIAVGVPIAGRNRFEFEHLIGFFVNTLVLRTELSTECTFRELINRVRDVALSAYAYQEVPFEKLVQELQPERDLSRNPLFQVVFQLRNLPKEALRLSNVAVDEFPFDRRIAKFDLTLDITETDGELRCIFNYNTDLFDASTMIRMQQHFISILEHVVCLPDRAIGEIPLGTNGGRYQLLDDQGPSQSGAQVTDHCIHRLFEEQAARTPDALAVIFEDEELTYRELNRQANQLARYLRKRGAGQEVLVGLHLERSSAMIVGLLAILKTGGAYVPLDPEYPADRIDLMVEDAQPAILLSQSRSSDRLPKQSPVIHVDDDWEDISQENDANLWENPSASGLAYVIYTSGSTGKPKGVMVEHRQVVNYSRAIIRRLDLAAGCSFAMVQPLMFDSSLTVILASLLTGGSLHVISKERASDPQPLGEYFRRCHIDFLKITPSHLAALLAYSVPNRIMPRRGLIMGGEESRWEWVRSLQAAAPGCAIMNHYGPTETTVGVLTCQVGHIADSGNFLRTPLGGPIDNTRIVLLDSSLEPVPLGVSGELFIGGDNVTRGYLNQAALTAERFIPDPFSTELGQRLYKTGDLARYLADGNIEFLGRIDHQVKIRGFRVEPEEIEAVLKQHPAIRQAAVIAHEDAAGQKRLVGYIVPDHDRAPTIAGKPRYKLPNGAAVAQLNKNETDYLYQEIFDRQAYLRHGVTIKDGDCIFDVGANIGLFTLFANQVAEDPQVYSFEPNPTVFEILRSNAALYGSDTKMFNCGLADHAKTAEFTFFPGFSLLSGFYADAQKEKEVVKTFMINQERAGVSNMAELVEHADAILEERFSPQTFTAELRTLSEIIDQEKIKAIDLLKINVEKSELNVLKGIKRADWRKIKQIVLEVDVQENLPAITALLESHGFEFVVDQELLLEGTPLCYVYAVRPSKERALIKEQREGVPIRSIPVLDETFLSGSEIKAFLGKKLPEHMVPSAYVFLDSLPLTPNGKIDRKALPAADSVRAERGDCYVPPRNPTETLAAQIWSDVLKVDRVGIYDNFFDLGGHSLSATQAISRIRDAFRIELPLRSLFESPTVAELAERIVPLQKNGSGRAAGATAPETPDGDYPLSFAQERFWFLNQLEPNNLAYRVSYGFYLTGPLHIEALERSLAEIVRRHETLRTTFHIANGKPVQVIAEQWSFKLSIVDLPREIASDLETEVQRLFEEERRRPFDLTRDLLLRAALLRLSSDQHVLFLNSHHIAWDHWCIELLFRELSILYQAFGAGESSTLAPLLIQYKDYALWQRKHFHGAELESRLAYWKRQLSGAPASLNLPTDFPRKPLRSRRGARQSVLLPSGLAESLGILSRQAGVSLFMTLLAAFQTLLHRITGQDDMVVGTPVAGRDRSETENLIGLFLNSLALRTDLSGNPTFLELLMRVREVALGAYDHQDLPFEKLVEELQPERDLLRTPIFQVFINMYNFREARLELDQLSVQSLGTSEHATQFDLVFFIREHHDGIHLIFAYDTDLFEAATIARMLGNMQVLLQAVALDPEQRISDLPILTEAERHQLLVEWNSAQRDWLNDQCTHVLFEEQVERSPEAVAVTFGLYRLTYRELNRRANQLAHYLQKLGVGPEVTVGICMERCPEMLVALLGVLKSGGAYVPLDPTLPEERLCFIMEDSRIGVLLTAKKRLAFDSDSTDGSPWPGLESVAPGRKTIDLVNDCKIISRENDRNPIGGTSPENLAYSIYTSGTTGQPKGVMIMHRSLVNYLRWVNEELVGDKTESLPAMTKLTFDAALKQLLAPLLRGATVWLVPDEAVTQPFYLLEAFAEQPKVAVNCVPSLWEVIVRELRSVNGATPKISRLFIGGEPISEEVIEESFAVLPLLEVCNLYGPTEATANATMAKIHRGGPIAIGRPIANTQIYILDPQLRPVPVGTTGELHVGGVGLARGYLNHPELTAEKFIPNPFSEEPGARLYKTGDRARYRADGDIEFVGRLDAQVKIRGFRIELGEIEAVLREHPAVRVGVVVAQEETTEETNDGANLKTSKRLVAYIVTRGEVSLSIDELRSYLKQKLPEYMVPAAIVEIEDVPLNSNGKIDLRAFPAPDRNRPRLQETFVASRTPVEKILVNIWSKVLNLESVGVHDNFFDLGGHSLLAIQVLSRVRDAFHMEVPLRLLFEEPTVAGLAVQIVQAQSKRTAREGAGS